jgi:membrane dipeptidase
MLICDPFGNGNLTDFMFIPIADLHCDLLWYLSLDSQRTANHPEVRCAIPQLRVGGVRWQTMAIFTETHPHSVESGQRQAELFKKLPKLYPDTFQFVRNKDDLLQKDKIGIIPAIENASAICSEEEELSSGLERLTAIQRKIGKLLYVSLTWNTENRFGGGALTKIGLKEDGKRLVDYLASKRIALDLSHASDYLAYDLLNYIEKKGLALPLLASHSNMRSVADHPRNLPDDIAKEIIKKDGVIGINFVRYFLGSDSPQSFSRQVERIFEFGGEDHICFGADFFCIEDLPEEMKKPLDVMFFPEYNHAGTYGKVLELWKKNLGLTDSVLTKIGHANFVRFLEYVPIYAIET